MKTILSTLVAVLALTGVLLAAEVTPTVIDFSFNCGLEHWSETWSMNVVRPLPDGKVLVGGYGDSRTQSIRLVRLNEDGSVDASFRSTLSQPVGACLVQPDGRIVAGTSTREETYYQGRISVYHLATNGTTLRTLFTTATPTWNWSYSVAPLPDGGFLLHTATGTNALYRFEGTGLNQTQLQFPPAEPSRQVSTLASGPDGKILVAGMIYQDGGADVRPWVWRLNADGTLDETFRRQDPPASNYGEIDGLVAQADGKVIVSGFFDSFANRPAPAIARLNADGSFDESFHLGTFDDVPLWRDGFLPRRKVLPLADGTLLVSGRFSDAIQAAVPGFYHVTRDGRLIRALMLDAGLTADSDFDGVAATHDGKLLLRSYSALIRVFADGQPRTAVGFDRAAGFVSAGTFATSEFESSVTLRLRRFGDPGAALTVGLVATDVTAKAGEHYQLLSNEVRFDSGELWKPVPVALFDDGHVTGDYQFKLSISGRSEGILRAPLEEATVYVEERDHPSGVDLSFDPTGELSIYTVNCWGCSPEGFERVRVDSRGRIVAGWIGFSTPVRVEGSVSYMGTARRLMRFKEDGSLYDKAEFIFDEPSNQQLFFEVFEDRVFLVGRFRRTDGSLGPLLSRLNPDLTPDTTFSPEFLSNDIIQAVTIDPDGRILVAGRTGDSGFWLRRLMSDGSQDAGFTNRAALHEGVGGIALQSTGKIVLSFFNYHAPMARLNEDGTVDASFRFEPSRWPYLPSEVTVGPDDRIYFIPVIPDTVFRLNADGSLDPSFQAPNTIDEGKPVLQNDGKILILGEVHTPNGATQRALSRLNADGSADASFPPIRVWGGRIGDTTLDLQGRVIVAGNFTRSDGSDGIPRPGLARLNSITTQPRIGFARSEFLAREGDSAVITIERSTDVRNAATVGYRLQAGSARENEDFVAQTGMAQFAPMQRTSTIRVPVRNDGIGEPTETAQLEITELPPGITPGITRATLYLLDAGQENVGIDLSLRFPSDVVGPGLILGFKTAGVQPDGRILVTRGSEVRRWTRSGDDDPTFKPFHLAGSDAILSVLNDGRMLARQNRSIIRLLADGAIDTTFRSITVEHWIAGFNWNWIAGIMMLPETEGLIVYGSPLLLARYQSNGAEDTTFTSELAVPPNAFGANVQRLERQSNGKLIVNWSYSLGAPWFPGTTRIDRLNPDGSLDPSFALDPALQGLDLLAVLSNGTMILSQPSATRHFWEDPEIVRLRRSNPGGQLDPSFAPAEFRSAGPLPSQVSAVLEQPDGRLLVAGSFDRVNGLKRTGVVRLHPDGSLDTAFDAHLRAVIGNTDAVVTGLRGAGPGEYLLDLSFPEEPDRSTDGFLRIRSESAPRFERISRNGTTTHLRLLRGSRNPITIEASEDLKKWVPLPGDLNDQDLVQLEDTESHERRFYRARSEAH